MVQVPVEAAPDLDGRSWITFTSSLLSASACYAPVSFTFTTRVNEDELPESSAVETVEAREPPWQEIVTVGDSDVWSQSIEDNNTYFHGMDAGVLSDTALVSPPLQISASEDFVVVFRHRFWFEASDYDGTWVYWDGGVVEISRDQQTWEDVSNYADPGYVGTLSNLAENPLSDRPAYSDKAPFWPDWDTVTLDFQKRFAGETVWIRFRIGSDLAVSAYGWDIDDIQFEGIDNTPFTLVVEDRSALNTYFADQDGDGHGAPDSTAAACVAPEGFVETADDCDDTDRLVYPGADEVCDGVDNDCDCAGEGAGCTPEVDESPVDGVWYYADGDGDGYGAGEGTLSCTPLEGMVTDDTDCDDTDGLVYPGADEEPGSDVDANCDGVVSTPLPWSPTPVAPTVSPPGGDDDSSGQEEDEDTTPLGAGTSPETGTPEAEDDAGGCSCHHAGPVPTGGGGAWFIVTGLVVGAARRRWANYLVRRPFGTS